MDHILNVCFFRFIQGLPGIEVSASARRDMKSLDDTLAAGWEREKRDHYTAMVTHR